MKGHKKRHCEKFKILSLEDGLIYSGTVYDDVPYGRGRLSSEDMMYEGEFANGKRHGFGKQTSTNGTVYTGNWANGLYHGQGHLQCEDGTVYDGNFHTGTYHGHGHMRRPHSSYEGQWCHGTYHGHGVLIDRDGTYEGEFANNLRHGQGTLTDEDENVYSGQWHRNERSGKGIYTTSDSVYSGYWAQDKQNGHGRYDSKTEGTYVGEWKRGKRHRRGTQVYLDGSKYEGGWSKDKRTGHGVHKWLDGTSYTGFWLKDNFHGRGTLRVDGSIFRGEWQYGFREGIFTETLEDGRTSRGPWLKDVRHGTFTDSNDEKILYLWGEIPQFKTMRAVKKTARKAMADNDPDTATAIFKFYPDQLSWTFLFKYDTSGELLNLVPCILITHYLEKHCWTLFKRRRYHFLKALVEYCPTDIVHKIQDDIPELFDAISLDFTPNPWMVKNVSYSADTRKRLLEGLHLGEIGRCPPKDPFTRLPLTPESGVFLEDMRSKARDVYKRIPMAIHRHEKIRDLAFEFNVQDYSKMIQNATDARDVTTIRRLLRERDSIIRSRRPGEDSLDDSCEVPCQSSVSF